MPWLSSRAPWLLPLLLLAVLVGFLPAQADPETERIAALVKQLGDAKFARRVAASKELTDLGESALPALRRAAENDEDLEQWRRARETIQAILTRASKSKTTGLELVVVDAGEFVMGSPRTENSRRADETQHQVRIMRPFLIGAHEVTQDEYRQVMGTYPSAFSISGANKHKVAGLTTGRFPVEQVTWYDALEFCNRLSKLDGYEPHYQLADIKREGDAITSATVTLHGGNGYRLPTEAEWEYACRGGTTSAFHFGHETKNGLLNAKPLLVASGYGSSLKWPDLGRTTRVGSYPPSPKGLFDMHGNVAEWCWDCYDQLYYDNAPKDDPQGPNRGDHRVLRGGSWLVSEGSCRSASRFFHTPAESKDYAGFRIARTPAQPKVIRK